MNTGSKRTVCVGKVDICLVVHKEMLTSETFIISGHLNGKWHLVMCAITGKSVRLFVVVVVFGLDVVCLFAC